jgi:hypothetical protein
MKSESVPYQSLAEISSISKGDRFGRRMGSADSDAPA